MVTFDFTEGRTLPFNSESCDWCQLTYQQLTIPSAWKLQSYLLATVSNSRILSLYGHVTFGDPPFWALSYDRSFLLSSQKCDDPPQNPPPSPPQAINNHRLLRVAGYDFWVTTPFTFDLPGHHHYHYNRTSNVSGVLKKEESFKWGRFQHALSYHSNEMTPYRITSHHICHTHSSRVNTVTLRVSDERKRKTIPLVLFMSNLNINKTYIYFLVTVLLTGSGEIWGCFGKSPESNRAFYEFMIYRNAQ